MQRSHEPPAAASPRRRRALARGGRVAASMAAAILGGAVAAGPPDAAPPAAAEIAVLSFNVRYDEPNDGEHRWPLRQEAVLAVLTERAWDFIGIQEALPHQAEAIAAALPGHLAILRSREAREHHGEACPLLYRRDRWRRIDSGTIWLSETPEVPGSRSWNAACPRIATFGRFAAIGAPDGAEELLVVNTHLDHASAEARERSASILRGMVERHAGPAIVLGDFNAAASSRTMRILQGDSPPRLHDAHANHPEGPRQGTFHAFRGESGTGAARIDWILFSDGLRLRDSAIDRRTIAGRVPSDHHPVKAVLAWPAPPPPRQPPAASVAGDRID